MFSEYSFENVRSFHLKRCSFAIMRNVPATDAAQRRVPPPRIEKGGVMGEDETSWEQGSGVQWLSGRGWMLGTSYKLFLYFFWYQPRTYYSGHVLCPANILFFFAIEHK